MIAEALLMAATVWYVPGWMRTEVPQEGVMPALSNAFLKAEKSVQGVGRVCRLIVAVEDFVIRQNVILNIT